MNLKSLIKYLVFFCYLLPCTFFKVSCDSGFDIYENKHNADIAKKEHDLYQSSKAEDTSSADVLPIADTAVQPDSLTDTISAKQTSYSEGFYIPFVSFAMFPTATSMSAIGNMFFPERPVNNITIAVSLLCSVLSVLPFKLFKKRRSAVAITAINLLSLIIFMISCTLNEITLLWGAWVLFAAVALNLTLWLSSNRRDKVITQ